MIPDQTEKWDKKHSRGDNENLRDVSNPFAELVEPMLPENSYILELGCGVGSDSLYFGSKGHTVLATDSSETVINQNNSLYDYHNVQYRVLNVQQPLPYDSEFDVVYSHLSLHYFSHEKTREIVENVAQVLKEGGIFAFVCKSKDEVRTKGAKEVEKDVFVGPKGSLHLFSILYTRQLLDGLFAITHLDEIDEEYNGRVSSIVRCIARKV
jgi:SAM-dependent methyltransferase